MKPLLICLILLFSSSIAYAGPKARIDVQIDPRGLVAHYTLSEPTTSFAFAKADVARADTFQVMTPGLAFSDDAIRSTKPFRRFKLLVQSATQQYDGQYAPVHQLSEGRLLYAFSLKGDTKRWDNQFTFKLPRGFTRSGRETASPDGYVFLGPRAYIKDQGSFDLMAPPETPDYLLGLVRSNFDLAISTYETKLAQKLPQKPTVITFIDPNLRGFSGSVTTGYATDLRFGPVGWDTPNPMINQVISGFVAHEVFHFWNGGLVSSNGAASWLHEGSAEYAAILTKAGASANPNTSIAQSLSENFNNCRGGLERLGHPALNTLPFLPNPIRYPCGVIMMWAADLQARQISDGKRDFFMIWRDMIAQALKSPNKAYSVEDFLTQISSNGQMQDVKAINLLRTGAGPERFDAVVAALKDQGAQIRRDATPQTRLGSAVFHLLGQNCRSDPDQSIGYGITGTEVTLDTHSGCGALQGSPVLVSIEGANALEMTAQDYASVQAKCASNTNIRLGLGDGRTLEVPCAKPLGDAEQVYIVRE